MFLKQSTAATIVLGPFLDDTDGKTPETGLTISQADVRLSKNGGAFAQKGDASSCSHMENGYYSCPVSTTDTGTVGRLDVAVNESGALPVFLTIDILPANVYDSIVGGTDKLDVSLVEWLGTAPNALQSGRVDSYTGAMAANVITAAAINAAAITLAKFGAGAIDATVLADACLSAAKFAAGAIAKATFAADIKTGNFINAQVKGQDNIDFGALQKASINTEVDNALDTAIPVSPTPDSINERIGTMDETIDQFEFDESYNVHSVVEAVNVEEIPVIDVNLVSIGGSTDKANYLSNAIHHSALGFDYLDADMRYLTANSDLPEKATVLKNALHRWAYGQNTINSDVWAINNLLAKAADLANALSKIPSKDYLAGTNNSDGDIQQDESTGDFNAAQLLNFDGLETQLNTIGSNIDAVEMKVDQVIERTDRLPDDPANELTVESRLSEEVFKDSYNKEVLARSGAEPIQYKIGTGGNAKTINVDYEMIGSVKKVKKEEIQGD